MLEERELLVWADTSNSSQHGEHGAQRTGVGFKAEVSKPWGSVGTFADCDGFFKVS